MRAIPQAPVRASALDIDALLHPSNAYAHPRNVLADPDLSVAEKRAILASWASDACAVDSAPALRRGANGAAVTYDDIIDALQSLDAETAREQAATMARRGRRRRIDLWRSLRRGAGRHGMGA